MRTQIGVIVAVALIGWTAVPAGKADIDPQSVFGAWLFDEADAKEATDWSVNGRHGDIVGDPAVIEGVFGSALELDGDGDIITVPAIGDAIPQERITVMAWVRNGEVAQNRYLFNILPSEPGRLGLWMPADRHIFWYFGDVGTQIIIFNEEEWVGEWVHFAFINDDVDDFMITYLNGEKLQRAGRISGAFAPREADLLIGGPIGASFKGAIDEFAIFDVALSQEDVKAIINEGLGRAALGLSVDPAGKVAAVWAGLKADVSL